MPLLRSHSASRAWSALQFKAVPQVRITDGPRIAHGFAVSVRRKEVYDAERRWYWTDGNGPNDGPSRRLLCRLGCAGLYEPDPWERMVRKGVRERTRQGSRILGPWTRMAPQILGNGHPRMGLVRRRVCSACLDRWFTVESDSPAAG